MKMNSHPIGTIALLATLFCAAANAAITITVTPVAGGTAFSIAQDSPNPQIFLDNVTTGITSTIPLSEASFTQNPSVLGFSESFGSPLGTLTELNGAGSSPIVGFRFLFDSLESTYVPVVVLGVPIELPPGGTYQFSYSAQGTSMVSLDFSNFIPGIYADSRPEFGQITTIVVPEPGANMLFLIGAAVGFGFRRTRSTISRPS